MLVLDSDHLTEYQRGTSDAALKLKERLDAHSESYGTTIIAVEEIMRGWMAAIRRHKDHRKQILAYAKLRQLFRFLLRGASWIGTSQRLMSLNVLGQTKLVWEQWI